MSRTFRRFTPINLKSQFGHSDEVIHNEWFYAYRYPGLSFEKAFSKAYHKYLADHHKGHYGVPRWYVRMMFTRPHRFESKAEIRRCFRNAEWDDHLDPCNKKAGWLFYW